MGSEGEEKPPNSEDSAKRKRRSLPEDAEGAAPPADGEESKRKKHRHHHKHRRHHSRRHRSGRGENRGKEEVEEGVLALSPGADSTGEVAVVHHQRSALETSVTAAVEIDDREEGEILEEEVAGDGKAGNPDERAPEASEFVPDQMQKQEQNDRVTGDISLHGASAENLATVSDDACPDLSRVKDNLSYKDEEDSRRSGYEANILQARLLSEENGFHALGTKESGRETRSRTPLSGESLGSLKERKKDSHKSRKQSDSRYYHGDEEKYESSVRSSSHSRYHQDEHSRERSREQCSRSSTGYAEQLRSDTRDRGRDETDGEKGSKRHRMENQDANDRKVRRDRGHDQFEDKYGTFDRGTRERHRGTSGERDRENSRDMAGDKVNDRYRERESSKGLERERDRENSRMRSHSRERERDREKSRVRSHSREKERDRQKSRMRSHSRERERDREKSRMRSRSRERERNGVSKNGQDRDKDLDRRRDWYRENDSRHSKYDDRERHKDSNESRRPHSQLKEEEKREKQEDDYEEKIEQQLAEQEEEDPEKIIEESRRRRLAILEKYKQKQQHQQLEQQPKVPLFEDHKEGEKASSTVFSVEKSPQGSGTQLEEVVPVPGGLGAGTPKSEHSGDMFCDDIFGESPTGVRKSGKGDDLKVVRSGLHDNWDDAEGYYAYRFGEVLDGRYEVIASHGKGVFSIVVRAKDLKAGPGDPEEVAIKIIRNNETMYKAGMGELTILKKLAGADPDDKRHCVRFLSSFKYRNHLCLVFESLHMNLREVLKKFGRNIGLKLTAVRAYAKQLFIALKHLRNCGVLHCDIKPDNMLVNEAKNVLKLCDFGNAMFAGKNEITPYLVSRFYRAPEIILGLPYDHPMDIWSVGCCLYELYAGKVLFPGPSNNDMIRLHMELKGPFPKKMLRKGAFVDHHYDQDLNFHATEEDPVTKKTVKRMLLNIKPKDFNTLLTTFPGEDPKLLAHFKDLLERIFILDPEKRMTVAQALSHPFITGK